MEVVAAVVIAVLVIAAAVLAVAETSLTHLARARAAAWAEEGRRGAAAVSRLLEDRPRALNPVLLLQLLCYLGAATLVALLVQRHWGSSGVLIALFVELVVIFVLAVAIPKTWALQDPDRAATGIAPLVHGLVSFPPLRWVTRGLIGLANLLLPGQGRREGPVVTEEEFIAMAGLAVDAEVIEEEEQELIESIIEFGDTVAREVMVPRTDMVAVPRNLRVEDVMEVVLLNGFSRLPAFGESIDDIVGIVYTKDLMRAERDGDRDGEVSGLLRDAHFVPETKRVSELLREMQKEQYHIAIVIDEYGGTAGLVTLEDLIEELVGEIVDEFDVEEPMVQPLPTGEVLVNARMSIGEINDVLDVDLPEGDWDSVGGLVFNVLGHVPDEGESAQVNGHVLVADRVQGRRINRIRIRPQPGGRAAEEQAEQQAR
ncbi:MAG: HlyC/CorC family transporter [Actinobacteria bacterium]|nr:MAG: HlyC/CorC family transporter [Actinomycetota bacterium]RIK07488.1 MAG: hypothetical protein DCC48_03010 [Acidobacteriota bacterium]